MPPQAPPLPEPYRIQGGVNVQVPIFPPDYISYIQTMGYDPWYGGDTFATTAHKDTMGFQNRSLDHQQDVFDWSKILNMAEMTGQYEGQPTLFAQQQQHQQGIDVANTTGYYNGNPTLQRFQAEQQERMHTAEMLANRELQQIRSATDIQVAGIGAGAQVDVANINSRTNLEMAQLDFKVRMYEAEGTRLYQEGLLKIQQGQLDLGYAQLGESRRQFDVAQILENRKFELDTQRFELERDTANYQMAANPRNWVAMSYAARGQTPPPEAASHGTPLAGELV